MKNFISTITIFLLFSTGILSAQVTEINLSMPRDSVGLPGDIIRMPVMLNTELDGENIISFRLEFNYSNSIKPVGTSVEGTLIESWGNLTINESNSGRIVTSAAGVSPISGDSAVLFYIDFELLEENTTASIYLYASTGSNNYFNENDYAINFTSGSIRMNSVPRLSVSSGSSIARGDSLRINVSGGTPPYTYAVSDPALGEMTSENYLKALNPGIVTVTVEDSEGIQGITNEIDLLGFKLTFPEITDVNPGDTIILPLLVSDLTGLNVVSGNFNIQWTEVPELELITENTLLENASFEVDRVSDFEKSYAFATTQPLAGTDTLAFFKVITTLVNNGSTIYLRPRNMFFNEDLSGNYHDGYVRLNSLATVNISGSLGSQLVPGDKVQLAVSGGTAPYVWTSSDPEIASVNNLGLVEIHKGGQFYITVEDAFGQVKNSATTTAYDGTIDVANDVVVPGTIHDLAVNISALPGGRGYSSFSMNTTFDSSRLEFQNIVKTGALSENFSYSYNNLKNKVIIAAAGTESVTEEGVLFYLRFKLKETATSNIGVNLNDVQFNEGTPNLVVLNGAVTPGDPPPVAGDSEINLAEDSTYAFATTDFIYSQAQGKEFSRVKILSLPATGLLTLSGSSVSINQDIATANLANLLYTPKADTNGTALTSFRVKVGDADYFSNNEGIITINITAVNDPPEFTLSGDVNLESNYADTTIALTAGHIPEDEKSQAITYALAPLSVDFANISINETTGDIMLNAVADAGGTQQFTVTANDGQPENNIVEHAFTLTVNVPNTAPAIADQSFDLEENSTVGTEVGTVVATDEDALTFAITAGNDADNFTVEPSTGLLTVNSGAILDYEATNIYSLTIEVSDGEFTSSAVVTINIIDAVGNEAPVIHAQSFSVIEHSTAGTSVGTVTASDPEGLPLAFSITGGNTDNAFSINSTTGEITVENSMAIDVSSSPIFELTVKVNDGELSSSGVVSIVVTDETGNSAPFVSNQNFTVAAGSANGTIVGMLAASDAEGDSLIYSITSGNINSAFEIDTNGQIIVLNSTALDMDITSVFTLTVEVSDGFLVSPATVGISLIDETGNSSPVVYDQNFSIEESSANGTVVGIVLATDAEKDVLSYILSEAGNTDNAFSIDGSTGEISVANTAALDFMVNPVFTLTVDVSDGNLTTSATLTINVEEANSIPTIEGQSFSMNEGSANGTVVGTVAATDADGDILTYRIAAGNISAAFEIDANTGELSVANNTALDASVNPTFNLTVEVSDGKSASSATVIISLTDESGNSAPVIANQNFTVEENSANGTVVGTVVASDAEGNALSFNITKGNTGNAFAINSTTGELAVADNSILDASVNPSFTLTVSVNDGSVASSATVTISLINVDGNSAPVITNQNFSLSEGNADGTVLGTVIASDAEDDALTYSIVAGNTNNAFAIDPVTGQLTVANSTALDASVNASFNLTVRVNDGILSSSATVTVSLIDETGNTAPVIIFQTFSVNENSANGTVIGTVSASDIDGDALSYNITAGNTNTAFAIDATTGELSVANSTALDASVNPSFNLIVSVNDGELSSSATVTISLIDEVGNTAPVIVGQSFSINENSANGTMVGDVAASDPDGDALTYSITGGNTTTFVIDATSGQLTVANNAELDASVNPVFNLTVAVSDGTLSSAATVTILLIDETGNTAPFISDQSFTIAENSDNATVVGTLIASDSDGDALSYTITEGNTNNAFAINSTTGELRVENNAELDFEVTPVFSLTVQVSDGTLSAFAIITINLDDVVENEAPEIEAQAFSIDENKANGTIVGTVTASDADDDALAYTIASGNTGNAFAINASTGQLTVANTTALDFETNQMFTLLIEVSDGALSSAADVTINLNDIDENVTGVEDKLSMTVTLFPNPVKDNLLIQSDNFIDKPVDLRLIDINGKAVDVHVNRADENSYRLKTTELNTGVYILMIEVEGKTTVRRIIKN